MVVGSADWEEEDTVGTGIEFAGGSESILDWGRVTLRSHCFSISNSVRSGIGSSANCSAQEWAGCWEGGQPASQDAAGREELGNRKESTRAAERSKQG